MSDTKLSINFLKKKDRMYYKSIIIFNKKYDIGSTSLKVDIPNELFKNTREKKIINITLIPEDLSIKPFEYKFNIFYGNNKAYCFLSEEKELLVEYNYLGNEEIIYENQVLKEYDGNGLVKRLVLINSPPELKISNKILNLWAPVTVDEFKDFNSFEISEYDNSNQNIGIKIIKNEEQFSMIDNIKNQETTLKTLFAELQSLVNNNISDKKIYKNTFSKYIIKEIDINFSQDKNILKEEFNTKEHYYLMYLYFVWYSIKSSFLNEKYNCQIPFIDLFNFLNQIYELYLKDQDLLVHEKIISFYSHTCFFFEKNSIEKYKSSNLNLIKKKEIKDKSVYGLSYSFLNKFILELNIKSHLFFPLLMLDCGIYYLRGKPIYGFNRESIANLKQNLFNLLPDIFFEYSDEVNEVKMENGFNYKSYGMVFLNIFSLLKNFHKSPVKDEYNNSNVRLFKHHAMLVSKELMHECFAHNKMIYNLKKEIYCPKRFFNRKKIVKLVPYSPSKKNEKINNNKGESEKFMEYFLGIYKNEFIIDLIFKIDYIGNLLDNVDYFVEENLQKLQQYIINKYKINHYKIKDYKDDNLSFEDEIISMNKLIEDYEKIHNNEKIKEQSLEIEDRDFLISKKNNVFIESSDDDDSDSFEHNENNNENEKDRTSVPFFKTLHIS